MVVRWAARRSNAVEMVGNLFAHVMEWSTGLRGSKRTVRTMALYSPCRCLFDVNDRPLVAKSQRKETFLGIQCKLPADRYFSEFEKELCY